MTLYVLCNIKLIKKEKDVGFTIQGIDSLLTWKMNMNRIDS